MSTDVHKPAKFFRTRYSIHASTLIAWSDAGTISCLRYPGGKRIYPIRAVEELLGVGAQARHKEKENIIYARVSSAKQRPDLERQIEELRAAFPGHTVIKDIASGVNFKRPGLRSLLDKCHTGLVGQVVVMHRDRLSRLAFDLLELVITQCGVKLLVHRQDASATEGSDLADDLLAITTVFVASHHGKRAAQNRRKRRAAGTEHGGQTGSKRARTEAPAQGPHAVPDTAGAPAADAATA